MSEHKKLYEICQMIGYWKIWKNNTFRIWTNIFYNTDYNNFQKINSIEVPAIKIADVREIIFTQSFMDKFRDYFEELLIKQNVKTLWNSYEEIVYYKIWELFNYNLNNPTEYLYNLIKE